MSFSAFSKEFTAHMYTSVENQFITKYLPQADGDAVRVYLYGLYLCQCKEDLDAANAAKLLGIPYARLAEIYGFWEDCDLVQIVSREPLIVEYLPVNAAVGKPKAVRAEKYTEFNRELLKLMQRAGKEFRPYEVQKILAFLEKEPMEPQAFLLVVEYCVKKDGEKLSLAHILNKAEKLCRESKYTYEQVEADLSDFNVRERELSRIFTLLGIYRKPQESDYAYLMRWEERGMDKNAVLAAAECLKKGSLATLDLLVEELIEKKTTTAELAKEYLKRRETLVSAVYKVARRLGVKVQNPRPYAEEYAEKWEKNGFGEESLVLLAGLGMKLGYGFPELDALLDALYRGGITDAEGVKAYCAAQDKLLKLLQRIQTVCGVQKKSQGTLELVGTWREWGFSEEMILEAAKRSAGAAVPLSYMNKLLAEWKRAGASSPAEIPERISAKSEYKSEAAIAADLRAERERFYEARRQAALTAAESARARAESDEAFRAADAEVRRGKMAYAKAEVYSPEKLPDLRAALEQAEGKRRAALKKLSLAEEDLAPRFVCAKCSDTGFLPDGHLCDCYRQ